MLSGLALPPPSYALTRSERVRIIGLHRGHCCGHEVRGRNRGRRRFRCLMSRARAVGNRGEDAALLDEVGLVV